LKKNLELNNHENAAVFLDAFSGTDFTVNAVYYDIARETLSDPLGVAFRDYRTSTLRLSNFLNKADKLETFRSSIIRMIRLSVEMNFKIDPELLDIA
jgi:tRNA nucleotidyltransferase/poly(A) polymerase